MKKLMLASAAAALGTLYFPLSAAAQPSPAEAQVNALEGLFGKQASFRRSQAKGLCASGHFIGSSAGRALSSAAVFSGDKVPVIARFSVGGGNPKASDKSKSVRGLALQFNLPDGSQWLSASISAPMFFVSKPEQFVPFLQVRTPDPATGKPDPEKLKAFNEANPETTLQGMYLAKAPVPASYATANYWSTNAFEFINAQGASQFVRWQFSPEDGPQGLSEDNLKSLPDDFLADELRSRVAAKPAVFHFNLQLAEKDDQLTDPTRVWPDSRKVVLAGKLVIDKVQAGPGGACDKITFNPLVLPKGMKPSADPVLLARSVPYAVSLGRRLAEAPK
jgi:catalase